MKMLRCMFMATAVSLTGCAANVVKVPTTGTPPVNVPAESSKNIVLNLSGAAKAVRAADWPAFSGEWRGAVAAEASAAGVSFNVQEGEPAPTGQPGTLISVFVNDYRYVSTGARYGLGVFTGNAFVDAKVRFLDLKTGQSFGDQTINTSSSAWQGVFSAMTDKQLQAIAKELVNDVKPR
ncbi:hypothetical protein [Ideonella sp. BN130291]|uniref:hypothetical protein n=1 Tax=Ideonella sp. BN130291 TaxID=3112940 RepID=UPI002E26B625|nr:hypothetical protein [Ideonella sp. BN130291]